MILSVVLLGCRYLLPLRMSTRGTSSTSAPERDHFERILGAIHGPAEVMRDHITNERQPRERANGNENHAIERFQRMQPLEFRRTTYLMEEESCIM